VSLRLSEIVFAAALSGEARDLPDKVEGGRALRGGQLHDPIADRDLVEFADHGISYARGAGR
jgi:hypothetical protein